MTKEDEKHPNFIGKILCSKGIGAKYTERAEAKKHTYKKGKTIETYRLRNGAKINLPTYYRNQLFSEEEREMLFLDKIEKGIIYVMGQKVHRNDENTASLVVDKFFDSYLLKEKRKPNKNFSLFSRESLNRTYRDWETDRKSTRLNSSHSAKSRMPSSA